jgi:peptide/nickel transport system permease protein
LRRYLLARLVLTVPLLLLLLTATFLLLRVAPGDPVTATNDRISEARADRIREDLGLNDPLYEQYFDYLADVATLDFGQAITTNRPIWETIKDRFPATFELTVAAMSVALGLGLVVGSLAARFRNTAFDLGGRIFGIVCYAAPIFWLGILAQLLFSIELGWFPTGGRTAAFSRPDEITGLYTVDSLLGGDLDLFWKAVRHLALPAITLGLAIGGIVVRLVRVNMIGTLGSDYVEAARARGVPERRIIFGHALKNALVPVVAAVGLQFALLLSGAVLTEATFSWPGIGDTLYEFLSQRDYTGVQAIVSFYAVFVVAVSLLIDVVAAWIDPRIRYS